jgi:2-polyprenyl-3-methyl-5-hydroxy-6-metoxy-1,4-benzoquinol methylase
MHGLPKYDDGRAIEWGKTSSDYGKHRPGPPPSFYARLQALGVGLPGQRILDLGTGTGLLAREFAKQGAITSGTDIATGQIEEATRLATQQGLSCEFTVASSETQPFPDQSFDCISAMQCWLYFDQEKTVKEVKRLLKPGGALMISHFSWLPRLDAVARASEQLVLKFNPQWGGKDWHGVIPPVCYELDRHFPLQAMFWYDEAIAFTRESWRGRMRACRGTGATLSPAQLEAFDREHDALLQSIAPESFAVRHRLDAHLFVNQ